MLSRPYLWFYYCLIIVISDCPMFNILQVPYTQSVLSDYYLYIILNILNESTFKLKKFSFSNYSNTSSFISHRTSSSSFNRVTSNLFNRLIYLNDINCLLPLLWLFLILTLVVGIWVLRRAIKWLSYSRGITIVEISLPHMWECLNGAKCYI